MADPPWREKMAYFASVDAALSGIDDPLDNAEQKHRQVCRTFFRSEPVRRQSGRDFGGPRRTRSAPVPESSAIAQPAAITVIKSTPLPLTKTAIARPTRGRLPDPETSFIRDTPMPVPSRLEPRVSPRRASNPLPITARLSDQRRSSNLASDSPAAMAAAKKRKRGSEMPAKPLAAVAQQIFGGLAFFYIPNDDRNKVRKLRIAKAKECGAQWVRRSEDATHVIVDKGLVWKDVEPFLTSSSSPSLSHKPPLVIVYDDYPVDCVSFGQLLDAFQLKYHIHGRTLAPDTERESSPPEPHGKMHGSHDATSSARNGQSEKIPSRTPAENQDGHVEAHDSGDDVVPSSQPEQEPTVSARAVAREPSAITVSERPHRQKDELDACIAEMQRFKDLPLEGDDEHSGEDEDDDEQLPEPDAAEEEISPARRPPKRRLTSKPGGDKNLAFEERFACHHGGSKDRKETEANPNRRIIDMLQLLCDYYSRVNDHWRTIAYRKGIASLKRHDKRITTEEEALQLPAIGPRLAKKIEEIAATDRLKRLEYAQEDPTAAVLARFCGIYGVGLTQANKWAAQGFRTLQDLQDRAKLNPSQRVGIEHYDDLNSRIPRVEVEALGEHVKQAARVVDPAAELLVGGSYRRGADTSGDIDFIVTKKGTTAAADLVPFLEELVDKLTREGFIVAALATRHRHGQPVVEEAAGSKWHGCCALPATSNNDKPPVWRRIDFLLVPETQYGAALIYFTGNDIFNRSMRLLASTKGMRLNHRGLYRHVVRGPRRAKINEGELIEGRDEKRIFEILGVKWREPTERWC